MKQTVLTISILLSSLLTAQTEDSIENLQSQIDVNKNKIEQLQNDVNQVTTENIYLKNVLDLQKPIKEGTTDNTHYKVIAVEGDKQKRSIQVEVMITAQDMDKNFILPKATLVDVLGNNYPISLSSINNYNSVQYRNTPLKMTFTVKNVYDEPKFIKMFEISSRVKPIGGTYRDEYRTSIQFKDLPVNWE